MPAGAQRRTQRVLVLGQALDNHRCDAQVHAEDGITPACECPSLHPTESDERGRLPLGILLAKLAHDFQCVAPPGRGRRHNCAQLPGDTAALNHMRVWIPHRCSL